MTLRLYRAPWSTNAERVLLALAHKGVEAQDVWIDYADRSPVEAVSGQGLVPVVVAEDGTVVVDSMEIVRWLEDRHPEPPLYPHDPARRAEVLVFVDWFNRVWKVAPNAIEAELGESAPDAARLAALAGEMDRHLDLFEDVLAGRSHLMGDEMSAADCAAYPFLKYAAGRDPADDELFHRILDERQSVEGRPRLAAWIERMAARPGAY